MYNNILLKQIELFVSYLKKLNVQDLCDLEEGRARISFVLQNESVSDAFFDTFQYQQYVDELMKMTSREQCVSYFEKNQLKRKDLEGILKCLGVAYNKNDNRYRLQSKVIENTVGKKLREDAIINK